MAEAARATDLYQGMVASGAVATRAEAKVGMLGAMYGGTRGESGRMLPRLTRRYPRAIGLVEEAARAGERGEVVHTLLGRGSPLPDRAPGRRAARTSASRPTTAGSREDRDRRRRAWGRFTRNFVVQGTAAEWALCWLADLRNRLWRLARTGRLRRAAAPGLLPARRGASCTPRRHLADDVAEEVRARRGRGRAGCCSAASRSTSRSTSRSSSRGPTPAERPASSALGPVEVRRVPAARTATVTGHGSPPRSQELPVGRPGRGHPTEV